MVIFCYDDVVDHVPVKDCTNCEFNLSGFCVGKFHCSKIDNYMINHYSNNCDYWEMDFSDFCSLCEKLEKE